MAEKMKHRAATLSTTTVLPSAGVGTMPSDQVVCGPGPGPETIEVEQVLGADMAQRVVESDMEVPERKPDIEQIIDVYVKDMQINSVDVIHDKVIVRGELAVKVMYVADLPNQPVHAFEKSQIRWTRDIIMPGAKAGMNATAQANVEFVDYDFAEDNNRLVHVTLVLKVWARVVTTTAMDVYALGPIPAVGQVEVTSAVQSTNEMVSANQAPGYGEGSVTVTGPVVTPSTGTSMQVSGTATVTGTNVNVRTGPGTNFPVVVKVNKDETVTLKDQAFGWYRVILADGTDGWIASWLLSVGTMPPKG